MKTVEELLAEVRELQKSNVLPTWPTDEQRADWAFGNAVIENKEVTREMARKAAFRLKTNGRRG